MKTVLLTAAISASLLLAIGCQAQNDAGSGNANQEMNGANRDNGGTGAMSNNQPDTNTTNSYGSGTTTPGMGANSPGNNSGMGGTTTGG